MCYIFFMIPEHELREMKCFYCEKEFRPDLTINLYAIAAVEYRANEVNFVMRKTDNSVPRSIFFHEDCFKAMAGEKFLP